MKKIVLLLILLVGILFPVASLARGTGRFGTVFNTLYKSETAHILTHIALFGALALVAFSLFSKRPLHQAVLFTMGIILLVGVAQETIQMYSINRFDLAASFFDLCVDLAGGSMLLLINLIVKKRTNEILT